jgi:hypothetical protein
MVVSNFTALLAIPQEELDYYRKVLAKQKCKPTRKRSAAGAATVYRGACAEEASLVVALFPDGDIRTSNGTAAKKVWDGRFDIPFGTPEASTG